MSDLIEKVKYDKESSVEDGKESIDLDDITPGARLRYEREQRNLSIQNIADHLYLEYRVIKCLENDEYDDLPPGIFIRGYIRNYAKYLEIPSEPLIKGYRKLVPEEEAEEEESHPVQPKQKQVRQTKQASSKDLWFKFLTFTIVVASLVLMALWRLNPTDPQTENGEETPTELIDGGESIQTLPIALEEEMPLPSEETSEVSEGENGENGNGKPDSTANTTTPVPNTNPSETTETAEIEQASETTTVPEPEVDADRKIKVYFDDDAWISITDSTEKKLKQGIIKKGEELALEGQPPFTINAGRLGKIRVEYKGETFSLGNHPNRDGKKVIVGEVME